DIFKIIADTLRQFISNTKAKQEELETLLQTPNSSQTDAQKKQTFESHNALILQLSQLPVSSLRCAHRVLTSREAAEDCVRHKVFELATRILQMPHQQPMLAYESLRVIFAVLSIFRGDEQPRTADIRMLSTTPVDNE